MSEGERRGPRPRAGLRSQQRQGCPDGHRSPRAAITHGSWLGGSHPSLDTPRRSRRPFTSARCSSGRPPWDRRLRRAIEARRKRRDAWTLVGGRAVGTFQPVTSRFDITEELATALLSTDRDIADAAKARLLGLTLEDAR